MDNHTRLKPFPLGEIVITSNAHDQLQAGDTLAGLQRHTRGDWGDVCAEDAKRNDAALPHRGTLHSVYRAANGTTFWVITDAGHAVTTVLLPEDY